MLVLLKPGQSALRWKSSAVLYSGWLCARVSLLATSPSRLLRHAAGGRPRGAWPGERNCCLGILLMAPIAPQTSHHHISQHGWLITNHHAGWLDGGGGGG